MKFTLVIAFTGLCALSPSDDGKILRAYIIDTFTRKHYCYPEIGTQTQLPDHYPYITVKAHHVDARNHLMPMVDAAGEHVLRYEIKDEEIRFSDAHGELNAGLNFSAGWRWLTGPEKPRRLLRRMAAKYFRWLVDGEKLGITVDEDNAPLAGVVEIRQGKVHGSNLSVKHGEDVIFSFTRGSLGPGGQDALLFKQAAAERATVTMNGLDDRVEISRTTRREGSGPIEPIVLVPRWPGDVIEVSISNLPVRHVQCRSECVEHFVWYYDLMAPGSAPSGPILPCSLGFLPAGGDSYCPLLRN